MLQIVYTILFVLFAVSFFVAMAFESKLPPVVSATFGNIGSFWMVAFFYFLTMVLFADLFRLIDHFFHIFPAWVQSNYSLTKLLYAGFVLFALLVSSIIGYINFDHPKTVHLDLTIPKKEGKLDQLSVVAVSDVHLGDMIRKGRAKRYVEMINRQKPDIILIAGDLFDHSLRSVQVQKMNEELQQLKAKYGVYSVLGNHEYFGNVNGAIDYITHSGITLLRDSAVVVDSSFVLIGRDDLTNRNRKPLRDILSTNTKNLPTILLDHQPVKLAEAVENNIDFQFSGHTHNGQIYPFSLLVRKFHELSYGYAKKGNSQFYVSSGLGLWGAPLRLGTQSELVDIHITFSDK
ncbi:MAG TPA: metallophosphoesterase [Prolixibacteraceae bacterium]|nr:metallophosphoesterase [Prolixibacteraceae bacterium]